MNSNSARKMLAALRSTSVMLIGLTPRTIVSMRKPGIRLALSAKIIQRIADPQTLHLRRRLLRDTHLLTALHRCSLLDGVG